MQKNSQSTKQPQQHRDHSPTVAYLLDKQYPLIPRKISIDSEADRDNFCLNFKNKSYTVLRVYIDSNDEPDIKLYYTKFTPTKKNAQICIIHGYGECTDDYIATAEYFAKKGYVVHMIDIQGHGYSGGDRVNQHIGKVLSDIETLLLKCCERELSTYILTQGLGGIFTNALLQENRMLPISGVILISPIIRFVEFSTLGAHWRKFILYIFPFIFSNLLVHNKINPTALTKSPFAIKSKIESVFFESFITLKMAADYDDVAEKSINQAYKFQYPCLICYGDKDYLQKYEGVRKLYDKMTSQDKQLKIFKGKYHDMHLDEDADEVRDYIEEWMNSRKNKIRWKRPKGLIVSQFGRRYFWSYFLYLIGFLLLLVRFWKKLKPIWNLVLKLLRRKATKIN